MGMHIHFFDNKIMLEWLKISEKTKIKNKKQKPSGVIFNLWNISQ